MYTILSISIACTFRYPVVEAQRVSDLLAEAHAVAVHRKAEEMLAQMPQSTQPDTSLLRWAKAIRLY